MFIVVLTRAIKDGTTQLIRPLCTRRRLGLIGAAAIGVLVYNTYLTALLPEEKVVAYVANHKNPECAEARIIDLLDNNKLTYPMRSFWASTTIERPYLHRMDLWATDLECNHDIKLGF